ncbi:MAG TPA: alkaline phosphatase [Myxococcota bacterium]|nr:alkaline phosphatase [Myxococcota bacterium]
MKRRLLGAVAGAGGAAATFVAVAVAVAAACGCGPSGSGPASGPATRPAVAPPAAAAATPGAVAPRAPSPHPDGVPAHVLFVLADGCGPAALELGRTAARAAGADLVLLSEVAPAAVAGTVATVNADGAVTDSAASATALATGRATRNGLCALGPAGERYETILEALATAGWRRGLVTDAAAVDASPAAFAAHAARTDHVEIAAQLAAARLDVLFGDGVGFFLPAPPSAHAAPASPTPRPDADARAAAAGLRTDRRDLVAAMRAAGAHVVTDVARLDDLRALPAAALIETTSGPGPASSAALTERALGLLSSPAADDPRFFLFAEVEGVDTAGHRGDGSGVAAAVADYDRLVAVALRFWRAHAGHTLVVFTTDHETGGMTLGPPAAPGALPSVTFATSGHTATPVWLYALGPGADRFAGTLSNAEVGRRLFALLAGRAPAAPAPVPTPAP